MGLYTGLSDSQLNQPTSNGYVDDLVDELRIVTNRNWQVVERVWVKKHWFKKDTVTRRFELFIHERGVLPWRKIVAVNTDQECICYMLGILSGIAQGVRDV